MKNRITLGLLIDQLVSGYARQIIDGVSIGSRSLDANLIVFSGRILGTPIGHEYQSNVIFDYITPGSIDALVMATGTQGSYLTYERIVTLLARFEGIPRVSIGIKIEGVPSIFTDNRAGMRSAMEHLVDVHKPRRVAFLKGPELNKEAQERFATYRDFVRARGLEEDPALWIAGDFTRAGGRRALAEHFQRHEKLDFQALVAASDEMAIGALEELRDRGFSVPRDVSLIGFDDIPDAQFVAPAITTVGQRLIEQGKTAATLAAELARGNAAPMEMVLPPQLVLRTSCGCLPRAVIALDSLPTRPGRAGGAPRSAVEIVDSCLTGITPRLPEHSPDAVRRALLRLAENAGTEAFLESFQEILNDEIAGGIDLAAWQTLITALQAELLAAARSRDVVETLQTWFEKALMLLSDSLRLEQGKHFSDLLRHLALLRRVTERLASGASMRELMSDLADELTLLDIRTCFIACYPGGKRHRREDAWTVPDRAEATLAWVDGKPAAVEESDRAFSPAEAFLPPRFLPQERRRTLIAMSTFFREDQIGYIVFEPGQRDSTIYESFCVQLNSLLNSSLLSTARQRVIDTLERERALSAILMDTLPDHIYFKDERSRFVLVNKSMAGALSLGDPSQAIGRTDFDFFAPAHAQPAFDAEQAIIQSGTPIIDVEEKETWPDGHETWVATTKMPLRDARGRIIGTFGLSKDITEHRRAEERILRLATLVESAREAIFGVDMEELVTSWNKGAEEVFGYTAEEMLRKPVAALMSRDGQEATRPFWEKVKEGREAQLFEASARKRDGTSIAVACALAPIRDPDGRTAGVAVIARDMTEEKSIQARLIQAQRLESLGTLAGGIAHQFNNINTVVKGYLDMLREAPGLSTVARSFADEALKGVDRLVDITAQLQGLTVSSEPGSETCQLNLLIGLLLRVFERRFEEMSVKVVLDMPETPPVRVHRSRAVFVLTSLLSNALDAMLDRPVRTLSIRTGTGPHAAFVEVRDTGCGIPREDIPRMFTPFFTTKGEFAAADSPQARVKGVGLSLSVCRSTVSESGGRIEVESESGVGTTFRVWLPTVE